jgi:hypothetical protein
MSLEPRRGRSNVASALWALAIVTATASAAEVEAERGTGLPDRGEWTFNLDIGVGAFGFDNSLYGNQRPDPSGDLSDDWFESYIKPALAVEFPIKRGALFAKASAVGVRTFSAPPTLVGDDASSFDIEDAYLGWRSGDSLGGTDDLLQITLGRAPYHLGHGMLIWDGAGDGGSRGGFWSGARQAWESSAVGRLQSGAHALEIFYLDRDELPEADTGSSFGGANYELTFGEHTTLGLSYLIADSDEILRDGMDIYNARAYTAPLRRLPGLSLELEYAYEENGDALASTAWSAQVGYTLANIGWSPRLSYRYAFFEGDDPATARNEGFDMLFPGFHDWGTWWQGEIGGEYFLINSNLISHQVRLHVEPREGLSAGIIGYAFQLDHPASFAPGVTSDDVAVEIDGYLDWEINSNFTASFVLAYAEPDDAIEQGFGRTESLSYGMVYVSYSY